jgi:YVTN family beta-propeller protein
MKYCFILSFIFSQFIPKLNAEPVSPLAEPVIQYINTDHNKTINDFLYDFRFDYEQIDVDPGIPPEGDYMGGVTFTKDGSRILLTNRMTDNITVFDWQTMSVITNIPVGDYPGGIAVSDSLAIVACAFSDEVYVINLNDYSIDTVFQLPAGQQPWVVRISPDGHKAYVSCDISNTCEVFDLITMSHTMTINNFPIYLASFGWGSENGRNSVTFTNFEITPDGNYLIVGDGLDTVFFFNTTTGLAEDTITGIPSCPSINLSGDSTKAIATCLTNPGMVKQIDIATRTITGSVTLIGYQISMALDAGVNRVGSKAFVGISNNSSAIVRFATSDFTVFTSTYTPFWIGTSPDHSLAISGQFNFSIVDFTTEQVLGQYSGNTQYFGAVSPVDFRAVGFDPYRHEGLYFYDYMTPSAPDYRGTTDAGLYPEGDAPHRVAITPDGTKAVVTNVLSNNATIVDLNTYTVDTIIPIGDRVQDVAITSDSRWAVICGFNTNSVKIIDLHSNQVVADVPTGTRPSVVSISPNDSFAYVGNVQSNTVSVIALDGPASHSVNEIPCGEIGVVWAAYGVTSDVKVDPAGNYVLVAVSFDDEVRVINTHSYSVTPLPVGDFPIQIAYDSTGRFATVTNAFSNNFSLVYVDGETSYVIGTFPVGDYPLRLDYNKLSDQIGISNYTAKTLVNINPRTGSTISTNYYTSYGNIIQVRFAESGGPIVLTSSVGNTPGHIHRGGEAIALPAVPAYFDYCPAVMKAAVVMPGPDYLTVIDWSVPQVKEVINIPLSVKKPLCEIRPNPFCNKAEIKLNLSSRKLHDDDFSLKIYAANGRLIKDFLAVSGKRLADHGFVWDGSDSYGNPVNPGIYFVELKIGSTSSTNKVIYTR